MVNKSSLALCIVGLALGLVGFLGSFLNIPYMAMWGAIQTSPSYTAHFQINAFGTLTLSMIDPYGYVDSDFLAPMWFVNFLPGILILAGAGLVGPGAKVRALGIIGGSLLLLGPVLFIAFQMTGLLIWTSPPGYPEAVFSLTDEYTLWGQYNLNILFGSYSVSTTYMTWFPGTGTILPLVGGILGIIGGGKADRD